MAERKPLTFQNTTEDNPFAKYTAEVTNQNSEKKKVNIEALNDVAAKSGFTSREQPQSKSKKELGYGYPYTKAMTFRVKEGLLEILDDLCYKKKLKKQEVLDQALLMFLQQTQGVEDLIGRYKNLPYKPE